MFFKKKRNPIIDRVFNVLLEKKFEGTFINSVYQEEDILYMNLHLPEHNEIADLEKILPNLQQEIGATAFKLGKCSGKYVEILFGMKKLDTIPFDITMLRNNTLQVYFPSAYGEHTIDFEDGASCHMLNGGVTRMGKTAFLLYLTTAMFLQNNGNIKLYISSAKLKDYFPFEGIPSVRMEKDVDGMIDMLSEIIDTYKKRDELLYSPSFRRATDAKGIRQFYPNAYHLFQPVFLIIDEYARFSNSKTIQDQVTELVETAGFVNVHVIIASQRPDASTVLKPRIRANLLCRMAFTTADKKNSEVILDREGAEKLGKIAGRGLLIDSDSHIIQVPLLEPNECDKLLEPYRSVIDDKDKERRVNTTIADKIQGMLKESISLPVMQGEQQSSERSEPSIAEDVLGWEASTNPKREG